uniref:CCHC-type domain-containing protein n=1 Tax=Mastacembelus armatus TaxID=205130 RepID=A0A7N9AWF8_9TELE
GLAEEHVRWRFFKVSGAVRDLFSRVILEERLKVIAENVLWVQTNQRARAYEVTWRTAESYGAALEEVERSIGRGELRDWKILNLDKPNFRVVTVQTFNPFVTDQQIASFLEEYVEVVSGARHMTDSRTYWTGRRQYQVLLRRENGSPDGWAHPPAIFSLGADRGYLYYAGQPDFCKRCRRHGHLETSCVFAGCPLCGEDGHEMRDCHVRRTCHGCGEPGHLYRECGSRRPMFAEVVAGIQKIDMGGRREEKRWKSGAAADEEEKKTGTAAGQKGDAGKTAGGGQRGTNSGGGGSEPRVESEVDSGSSRGERGEGKKKKKKRRRTDMREGAQKGEGGEKGGGGTWGEQGGGDGDVVREEEGGGSVEWGRELQ